MTSKALTIFNVECVKYLQYIRNKLSGAGKTLLVLKIPCILVVLKARNTILSLPTEKKTRLSSFSQNKYIMMYMINKSLPMKCNGHVMENLLDEPGWGSVAVHSM